MISQNKSINYTTMKRILVILFSILLLASCSRVSGTYVNEKGGIFDQIEFVGNSSCIVTTLGMRIPATYHIDNGYVIVSSPNSADLMFKIQDSNTLVGEGFFNECVYRKGRSSQSTQAPEQGKE